MKKSTPCYNLENLILHKYGERNFETGCELVARWIRFETKSEEEEANVKKLCTSTRPTFLMKGTRAEALMKLFALHSENELFAMNKKQPDIIISTQVGGITKYVFNAPLNPKNIRKAVLTDDPEKAKRFWTEEGATQYIRQFPKGKQNCTTETFAPAAAKN